VKKRKKKTKERWFAMESDVSWQAANKFGSIEIAIRWTGEGLDYEYAMWNHRTGKQLPGGQIRVDWDYNASTRNNEERLLAEINDSITK